MNYLKEPWNWVHLLGSCVLTIILSKFMSVLYSGLLSWTLGLLWELFDQCNKDYGWEIWFLDPAGFDWRDWLVMDLIGVAYAIILTGGLYA